jgi:DNA-binding LacI/PurR family transcriptional regulator
VPSDYTGEEGSRATRRLLIDTERPTAIIYDNDVMAVAGLAVAQEMGLTVPGDCPSWPGTTLRCAASCTRRSRR